MRTRAFVWLLVCGWMAAWPYRAAAAPKEGRQDLVHPQASPPGPPLSLADALREVMEKNPELAALRQDVTVVRQRPRQERFLAPPMAEAQVWQWPVNTLNPTNVGMYMFLVSQELPGRGKRDLRVAVAEKNVALAENDVALRIRDLASEVRQAYTSLFIARRAIEVHQASVELLRQITDVAQDKYSTGRISQQDVLKPTLELSRLHGDIITFNEQASKASARLNTLMDRTPEAPIGPLLEPREQRLLADTATLQRLAIERQPELIRNGVEVERAEAQLAVATHDLKPDFVVQGGYMLTPRMTDAWMGRIGITWPKAPWSRGRIDARVAEQTAAVDAAKGRTRALENRVRLAVHDAYVRAKSAEDRAALLRTTILPQARQTLDVSRVAYQSDRLDFQALLDNERVLLDSELEYFRAVSDFQQAISDLERAIGTDLPPSAVTAVAEV
jgi:cobalt-zinc-cadmium efflux system outer membrane protein